MSSKSNLDEFLLAKLTADLVVAQHEAKVAAIKAKILALELELREESASGAVLEPVSGLAITALTINSTAEPIIQPQKSPLEAAKPTYAPVSKPPLGPSKALAGITKTSHPHFIHSDIPVLSSDCSKSTGSFDSSTIPPLVQSTIVNDTPSQVHSTKESNDYKPIKVLFKRSGSETKSPNIMGLGSSDTFSGMIS
ncbi:hypothetical protein M413DRAFT_254179 [Hebeloma cylindrosporum]|uniref:Uncharacterized protein n=1 Tax=Hebeloma cylindrosporum TaxID=76867 RepID=A0A0C2Y9L9_HEBCY|nr:hypothetical protein M413DRAFT_254179 [Hebeloma cylindrosporum h7]